MFSPIGCDFSHLIVQIGVIAMILLGSHMEWIFAC